ncbi:MAG: hypothetical protein ACLPPF_10070 [Rhodomicrobium sp.]
MTSERDDLVLKLLRDLRSAVDESRKDMQSMRARIEEMHETSITAMGLAGHANVQHQTVRSEIDDLKERVQRLEEQMAAQ